MAGTDAVAFIFSLGGEVILFIRGASERQALHCSQRKYKETIKEGEGEWVTDYS